MDETEKGLAILLLSLQQPSMPGLQAIEEGSHRTWPSQNKKIWLRWHQVLECHPSIFYQPQISSWQGRPLLSLPTSSHTIAMAKVQVNVSKTLSGLSGLGGLDNSWGSRHHLLCMDFGTILSSPSNVSATCTSSLLSLNFCHPSWPT